MSLASKLIAVSCLALVASIAVAAESIRFNQISVDDGLSQATIQSIIQDRKGFIWIGTQLGLNRFDGYEFINYFYDSNDPQSLSQDFVRALHEDAEGGIWVGTERGGLNRLDPVDGTFVHYRHDPEDSQSIGADSVRVIVEDAEGRIWVGTDGGGLNRLDPATGRFTRFQHNPDDPDSLSSNRVKALHIDSSGVVWVGTDGGGLDRIDPVRERLSHMPLAGDSVSRVRSIVSDQQGMIWVGTNERGLFRVHPHKGVMQHFRHDPADPSSISSNSIRALLLDADQNLWIGTNGHGLNRYDARTGGFFIARHDSANPRSLRNDNVASLFQDRGGVIWVGTHSGISIWNPLMGGFRTYARVEGLPGELSNNLVTSFAELPDAGILVGTVGGLNLVDLNSGYARRLDLDDGVSRLTDERVFALAAEASGDIWVGTRAGGLNFFDAETDQWRSYRHDPEDPTSLGNDGVTSLLLDGKASLYVGTFGGGLHKLNLSTRELTRFVSDTSDPGSLCSDRVIGMMQDRAGVVWVLTDDGGLCSFDPAAENFTTYRHDPADATSLSTNAVWSVAEDPAGNLWIGTADRGVNLWRAADRDAGVVRFTRIGVEQGLRSPLAYGMLSDTMGRIWISSNQGLTRIDGNTMRMRHFTADDGLQGNGFTFAAAFRSSTGELFFGGGNGFNAFYPDGIRINTHPPQLALTGIQKNYQALALGSLNDSDGRLELKHSDQHLIVEYAALDFTNSAGNTYQHRLEGFDTSWIEDGGRHRVTYTNLLPGAYELRIRAANNDGVWSSNELRLPIVMRAAPWATPWAQASYVLAVLLALAVAYRTYSARLARAARENEMQASLIQEITERQEREQELAITRRRAQRYLDVVEVIILALDQHGNVTLVNQKGVRVLGYPESEIIGRNFYDCFVPEGSRDDVREHFQEVDQYAYSESPIKPKEGNERIIAWHTIAAPQIEDGQEDSGGLLISGIDMTQVRNLERELREAQKMEALGTLSRGVAHDFNNILSSILGYAELSQSVVREPDKVSEYLDKLESSVDRARDLVARILTFGRGSGQPPRPVRVSGAVEDALELLHPVLAANVSVEADLSETGVVLGDQTQLVQVVINLTSNAAQAMRVDGGKVKIEVSDYEVGVEEARSWAVLVPGPHVRLSVSDNGPGMDDFTMSRIFDPFFTTRSRDEGTGLGLSVVHGIVTQLRGTVQVFSEPGRGARFDIYLPCCSEEPGVETEAPKLDRSSVRGSETVLFVEDEASVRAVGEEALSGLGYRVITANDGSDGLKVFRAREHEIDVVVTDQTMPNLLGHKLAEQIKELNPDMPVVLMSGAGHGAMDNVDVFIDKPFTLLGLGQAVRSVLPETSS